MFSKEAENLLHKSLINLPLVVSQKTLRHDVDDLMGLVFPGLKLAIIADVNTELALGKDIHRALKERFLAGFIFLEATPAADMQTVDYIRAQTTKYDALIAVGSGTINDLCKYAAFLDGKPYLVFPTAASMNGYLSANASITVKGFKKTCKAAMPQAVFCDLSVIAAAPVRLSKSGLGDSLARPTAQADWLLSHLLLGTMYDESPFSLLKECEPVLYDNARGIAKNDPKTIELLMQVLLLSGLGMTIASGSYPASQGEHMIAHAYEMMPKPANDKPVPTLHGEEIGVTTLAMARLQEKLLRSSPALHAAPFPEEKIKEFFGKTIAGEAAKAYQAKMDLLPADAAFDWSRMASAIEKVMLPSEQIFGILQAAEAPHSPEMLGWPLANYHTATHYARFLRERFTFLDLA